MNINEEYRTRFMVQFYADGLPFPSLESIVSEVEIFDTFVRVHFRWVPFDVETGANNHYIVKKSNNDKQLIKNTISDWSRCGKKEIRIYHINKYGHIEKKYRAFSGIVAGSVYVSDDCYFGWKHDNPHIEELSVLVKFKKEALV